MGFIHHSALITLHFLFGRVAQPGESVCLTNRRAKVQLLPRPLRSGVAKRVRQRIVNALIGGSNPPARANSVKWWRGVNGLRACSPRKRAVRVRLPPPPS